MIFLLGYYSVTILYCDPSLAEKSKGEGSQLESFIKELSQSQSQGCPVQEHHSPIKFLVPFLQDWALEHIANLVELECIFEVRLMTPDHLHDCWKQNRRCRKALDSVIQSLSKCLQIHNVPPYGIEPFFQDYTALLQRSRDQIQEIMAFIQQMSALKSIS